MHNQRLGCVTPLGLLGALITLLAVAAAGWLSGGTIFSPGALNAQPGELVGGVRSHAETGGNCAACHTAPWNPVRMTERCMDCHQTVKKELTDPSSLHGALVKDAAAVECRECHTEHHGADAILTRLDIQDFPHEVTGFSLRAHAEHANGAAFQCDDCHTGAYRKFEMSVCADCHGKLDGVYMLDHQAAFGLECLNCHDGIDFFGSEFTHAQTVFPLSGKHGEVQCQGCHQQQTTLTAVQDTPTKCNDCHRDDDPHGGQLGEDCAACHSPEGWISANFDHNIQTSFQLAGKHQQVRCADCHIDNVFAGTPRECAACHAKDDAHQGQLGTDCAACHTNDSWAPSTFDHARAAFQLTGAHQTIACANCHTGGQFKGIPSDCASCHSEDDKHQGQFGTDCAACHTTTRWAEVTFNHANTAFPLTGAHSSTACLQCHSGGRFAGTPSNCASCHAGDDHHQGQFGSDCIACHTTNRWSEVTFNHANTAFPLTGAHERVPCLQCHSGGAFQGTAAVCTACHAEPAVHVGLFGTDCQICHSTSAWLPAGYNGPHTFPMNHGDANGCRDCHPSGITTWTCYTCHDQGEIVEEHQDEGIGDFSNCMRCHANGDKEDDDDRGGNDDDDD